MYTVSLTNIGTHFPDQFSTFTQAAEFAKSKGFEATIHHSEDGVAGTWHPIRGTEPWSPEAVRDWEAPKRVWVATVLAFEGGREPDVTFMRGTEKAIVDRLAGWYMDEDPEVQTVEEFVEKYRDAFRHLEVVQVHVINC